jgi:hypothetical protein
MGMIDGLCEADYFGVRNLCSGSRGKSYSISSSQTALERYLNKILRFGFDFVKVQFPAPHDLETFVNRRYRLNGAHLPGIYG